MDDEASETPQYPSPYTSGLTHAGITGKVPKSMKWSRGKGKTAKRLKLAGHQRKHVNGLKKSGVISQSAAKSNGLG